MLKRWVKEWIVPLAIAVLFSLALRTYGVAHIKVYNISMQSTLYEGQRLLEEKVTYRFKQPERGDIIILNGPEYPERLIKRVVGLPGETIDLRDGRVWIDGEPLDEPYAVGWTGAGSISMPYQIPDNAVFAMGDNREHSIDSRSLGAFPLTSVEGRILLRFWPADKFGTVD